MTFLSCTREPFANRVNANGAMSISESLVQQQLRQQQRRRRRLHEPVAAEPGRAPEALQLRHRTEDRLVVGRRLVQARPRRLDPGPGQRRRSVLGLLEHLLQEVPVDVGDVTGRLVPVAHARSGRRRPPGGSRTSSGNPPSSGLVRGTAGNVPVTAMWRRYGRTGISRPGHPADRRRPGARRSRRPAGWRRRRADVRTPCTRPPATSMPSDLDALLQARAVPPRGAPRSPRSRRPGLRCRRSGRTCSRGRLRR